MKPSTPTSRNVFVHGDETLSTFKVLGEPPFAVIPPVRCKRGHYRVDLDRETRIASFSLIRLVSEEEAP